MNTPAARPRGVAFALGMASSIVEYRKDARHRTKDLLAGDFHGVINTFCWTQKGRRIGRLLYLLRCRV